MDNHEGRKKRPREEKFDEKGRRKKVMPMHGAGLRYTSERDLQPKKISKKKKKRLE